MLNPIVQYIVVLITSIALMVLTIFLLITFPIVFLTVIALLASAVIFIVFYDELAKRKRR